MKNKVIITCAITGGIHTPTLSKYLPYKPEDIARQSLEAAEAGASILHLHARNPDNGQPTGDINIYKQFLGSIYNNTDAVINITTGGSPNMTPEERLAAVLEFQPEMCSLNMGSMNFSFHPLANKIKDWQFEWEEEYIRNSDAFIFRNTFHDIEKNYNLTKNLNIKFEHECYDLSHLYNLAFFRSQGYFQDSIFVQGVFGILGGIGASLDNLAFMKNTAQKLFGDDLNWSTLSAGKTQISMVTHSALMGGHVRVGLEDSLFLSKGQLAESNASQVKKIRKIIEELGFEVATPDEARQILGLKGKEAVNIS
ncbi:3-keto-5-aminohexanoate cleavage protein [Acinetobacter pittii]|uniref:3-keto-5-aminohexanoate cleavage protein n=1 Tax=Acinetobacter pittii TaxID=48296 RepID=UPI0021D1E4B4|nr:3-keto-5-aminohexanoate cleavage protein [Acinetobacter pittii]MCU4442126.1 3-keto-5-aminohexanoate cleavage protein [Acinetobacter pittii]